jgi:hypothetical protein
MASCGKEYEQQIRTPERKMDARGKMWPPGERDVRAHGRSVVCYHGITVLRVLQTRNHH